MTQKFIQLGAEFSREMAEALKPLAEALHKLARLITCGHKHKPAAPRTVAAPKTQTLANHVLSAPMRIFKPP